MEDFKKSLEKAENFAKKIIGCASDEKLAVKELESALGIAKEIAENSTVDRNSIEKTVFNSTIIESFYDEKFSNADKEIIYRDMLKRR